MGFPGGSDGKESITIIIKNLGFKKKKKTPGSRHCILYFVAVQTLSCI